jgi:MFS family permease
MTIMAAQPQPIRQRYNMIAFGADTVFFSMALGCINPSTILPAFAAQLGGSEIIVGILIAVFGVAWSLPQLFAGNFVAKAPHKKIFLIATAIIGRPAILIMAAVIYFTQAQPTWLILVLLNLSLLMFLGTDAVAAVAWFDILGRAFPPEKRGQVISQWQAGASIAVMAVAWIVGQILGSAGPGYPNNYALLFAFGGGFLFLSAIATMSIYEPPTLSGSSHIYSIPWKEFMGYMQRIWRSDIRFRRIAMARMVFTTGLMAVPFYVRFATEKLGMGEGSFGLFIFAQTIGTMIASLALGRVADRFGSDITIRIGSMIIATAPLFALMLSMGTPELINSFKNGYVWVYICIGLANNLAMLGYINYVLDIAPIDQRPLYTGIVNAINTIGVIAPILAGWLLDTTSYPVLFGIAFVINVMAIGFAFRLPSARGSTLVTAESQ